MPQPPSDSNPVLLAGGNPQIAKAEGDAPVQAWIAAMPGWKSPLGQYLDRQIVAAVPNLKKAVKWNSPLYGSIDKGWFLSLRCFDGFVRVAFFQGALLSPPPPGPSNSGDTRYLDLHRDQPPDDNRLSDWIRQAAALPGVPL